MSLPSTAYQDIIDWARSQQELEAHHSRAAPITAAQRKALLDLLQLIKPVPAHSEPEVGDTNWVGLLHRFRDAYPDTTGVSFTEEAVDTALQSSQPHQQRWVCRVVIAENEQRPFPGPAEAASFARKKDAKQYAARCAVEWLRANRLMPGSGDEVRFHKGTVPSLSLSLSSSSSSVSPSPPKRQKVGPAEPAASGPNDDQKNDYDKDNDDTAASPPARGASTPPAHHEANPGSEEDKPSYASLVAALCHKLGFRPPSYRLEQVRTGYWSGRPELGDMEGQPFPADLGHVTNVLGKNAAKERIAEEVLKELRRVEEEREGDVREILRSLRPPVLG